MASRSSAPRRAAALLLCSAAHAVLAVLVFGEVEDKSLFRRTGLSPIVIWGEITDGEHRLARVRRLEMIKCSVPPCPGEEFRIAYKLDSFLRAPWEDKITFRTGERLILFLRKFTEGDGNMPEGDLYTLMWGAQGRFALPGEGEAVHVGAVRAFQAILAEDDVYAQERMILEALSSPNPILAVTAFEEATVQGMGTLDLVPDLAAFFQNDNDAIRVGAMKLLGRILSDALAAGQGSIKDARELSDLLRGHAALDPSEVMRVEAVRVLGILGGEEARSFLEKLAKEDASQMVRYEAERTLLVWGRGR